MRLALVCISLVFVLPLWGSHIIGGNFKVTQTGNNSFEIDLAVLRDCGSQGTNPVQLQKFLTVAIFDQVTGVQVSTIDLAKSDSMYIDLGDSCYTPTGLCIQEIHMINTITLADNSNGYTISAQVCCRNSVIDNILNPSNAGITWTAEIPDPALSNGNSSPDLGEYPSSGYFCLNYQRELDLGAVDPDGDSLHYELVDPLNSIQGSPIPPPPYNSVVWLANYSTFAPLNGNPALTIDPQSGLLKGKPNQLGEFVFAYQVTEFREGVRIGSVRRDLQIQVLNCVIDLPPIFIEPTQTSIEFLPNQSLCADILVVDSNLTDTVNLTTEIELLVEDPNAQIPSVSTTSNVSLIDGQVCWSPSCSDAAVGQMVRIKLKASSQGCNGIAEVEQEIEFSLPPIRDQILPLIPNVFTPNGDGVNDVYTLTDELTQQCTPGLDIKIYNRWGVKVYESSLKNLAWEGDYNGRPLAPGVYFFVLNGTYGNEQVDLKHFITLNR